MRRPTRPSRAWILRSSAESLSIRSWCALSSSLFSACSASCHQKGEIPSVSSKPIERVGEEKTCLRVPECHAIPLGVGDPFDRKEHAHEGPPVAGGDLAHNTAA